MADITNLLLQISANIFPTCRRKNNLTFGHNDVYILFKKEEEVIFWPMFSLSNEAENTKHQHVYSLQMIITNKQLRSDHGEVSSVVV